MARIVAQTLNRPARRPTASAGVKLVSISRGSEIGPTIRAAVATLSSLQATLHEGRGSTEPLLIAIRDQVLALQEMLRLVSTKARLRKFVQDAILQEGLHALTDTKNFLERYWRTQRGNAQSQALQRRCAITWDTTLLASAC